MAVATRERDPLALAFDLAPGVALRPERFGALAYDFGTRRLTFLKTPELARVVASVSEHVDLRHALVAAEVQPDAWAGYARALGVLAEAGMLVRREQASS